MPHDPKVCFQDVKIACELIIQFIGSMSADEYFTDAKTKSAIERQFEIIGEALNRVKKINPELLDSISYWQHIIGFRNVLSHCYNTTSDESVYGFATDDVHTLLSDVTKKLKD